MHSSTQAVCGYSLFLLLFYIDCLFFSTNNHGQSDLELWQGRNQVRPALLYSLSIWGHRCAWAFSSKGTCRTNYLYMRALDPVLCQPQRLYTFPTLCHLSPPFKKAWNISPRPFQGTARKPGCWVRITWVAWSKEDGVLVLQQFASPHLPFQTRQLRLTVSALCERGVSLGKCEPGGLTGREGVREPGCILTQAPEGHHCNLKPTNEIKLIKKKKKRLAQSP